MSKSVTAKIETITPEMAKSLLSKNGNNRNMSERSLNHYVRQINDGAWTQNGDSIRIAKDGTLLDGQHRLSAIIKTGKSLPFIVVRGLSKSVMPTIDTGRSRTVADHLKLQNKFAVSSHVCLSAAVSLIFKFKRGKFADTKERITPAEAIAWIDVNPGILKSMEMTNKTVLTRLLTPSILVATHFLFTKINKFKAEEFFEKLATGENLGATSPILKLRTQLFSMRSNSKRTGALHQKTFVYYIVAAFTAFLENRRVEGSFKFVHNAVIELPKKS